MEIVWDEWKRQQNLAKHCLDFVDLTHGFFEASTIAPSRDGRFVAIGDLDDSQIVTVVFAPRGTEAISIISMRPASRKERGVK